MRSNYIITKYYRYSNSKLICLESVRVCLHIFQYFLFILDEAVPIENES